MNKLYLNTSILLYLTCLMTVQGFIPCITVAQPTKNKSAANTININNLLTKNIKQNLNPDLDLPVLQGFIADEDYPAALRLLKPYIQTPSLYPRFYSDYLVILFWSGKQNEAIKKFERLPDNFTKRPYLLQNMAAAYFRLGDYPKAADLYQQTLNIDANNEAAHEGIINCYLAVNQKDRATDASSQLVANHPNKLFAQRIQARVMLQIGKFAYALNIYHQITKTHPNIAEAVFREKEDTIAAFRPKKRETMMAYLENATQDDPSLNGDYILTLVINGNYARTTSYFERLAPTATPLSPPEKFWVGWAYFKLNQIEKASAIFNRVLIEYPQYERAKIGLTYCLAKEKQFDKAHRLLDSLNSSTTDIQFARAFIYEQADRYWDAIREYDDIIEKKPSQTAQRLRLQTIASLGTPSTSFSEAALPLPADSKLSSTFLGDIAMGMIHWDEPQRAKRVLNHLMSRSDDKRFQYDYLIALAENNEMEKVVEQYKKLSDDESAVLPSWIKTNTAKAYLYLDQPEKSLSLYEAVLAEAPQDYNARLGKFYSLQELREWTDAEKVLDDLDLDTPPYRGEGRYADPDWRKLDILLARGWLYAYQDRLKEAQAYFSQLRKKAPANGGIRSGLAHVYYWRGWPRKALQEFNILRTTDPESVGARLGRVMVLNDLGYKKQARLEMDQLITSDPKNKHVQQLQHRLEMEDKRELTTDIVLYQDDDDTDDLRVQTALYQPLTLRTRLKAFHLYNHTLDTEETMYLKRWGLGIDHIFNPSWRMSQALSVNQEDGNDLGSLTDLSFTPNDYWRFGALYDTYYIDIPLRARNRGIDAKRYEIRAAYRLNDNRAYSLNYSQAKFSDGNTRRQWFGRIEQGLWRRNDWHFNLSFDFYGSRNTLDDTPYFNPDKDHSATATLAIRQIIIGQPKGRMAHQLFLTGGAYKQEDHSTTPLWRVRYEQEYDLTNKLAFLVGYTRANQNYDGEALDSNAFYLTLKYHF